MSRLIILDYANAKVHFYDVDVGVEVNDEYLERIGFKESEFSYMICDAAEIVFHKKPLSNEA